MSVYAQQDGITRVRNLLNDGYASKSVFRYSQLQGPQDGTNKIFQIPQERITVFNGNGLNIFPQMYKNNNPLVFNTDYSLLNPLDGTTEFVAAPDPSDTLDVSFYWNWFTDQEWDSFLTDGANNVGITTYYTGSATISNPLPIPPQGSQPSDIADGLYTPLLLLAAAYAAEALALRYSTRYDTSAGEQSFSPSQMAKSFGDQAEKFNKKATAMRDDFYKGQGRQYQPSTQLHGYVLPNFTPAR